MLPKPTVKQDWRWEWLEEQALVGQREHGKPPPLYSSVADLKAVLDDYLVRNKDNKPEILPADDPGLLIFGFLGFYNDTNGKEVAEFFQIGLEDVKQVEIEEVRKDYCYRKERRSGVDRRQGSDRRQIDSKNNFGILQEKP